MLKKLLSNKISQNSWSKPKKITENTLKTKAVPDVNWRNVEEVVIPPEERQEVVHELRQVL